MTLLDTLQRYLFLKLAVVLGWSSLYDVSLIRLSSSWRSLLRRKSRFEIILPRNANATWRWCASWLRKSVSKIPRSNLSVSKASLAATPMLMYPEVALEWIWISNDVDFIQNLRYLDIHGTSAIFASPLLDSLKAKLGQGLKLKSLSKA